MASESTYIERRDDVNPQEGERPLVWTYRLRMVLATL